LKLRIRGKKKQKRMEKKNAKKEPPRPLRGMKNK